MKKKYYIVEAKCGHVGRNNHIIKSFPTKATCPSEAASKARYFGRVKHNRKDAIVSVRECTKEEFHALAVANHKDPYFNARNIQEQRMTCDDLKIIVTQALDERPGSHKEIRGFHKRKERQECREAWRMIREYQAMPEYAY